MDINFKTDRLLIMHYPIGAGGKFVQMCLALHSEVLFIHEKLSRIKMRNNFNNSRSFDMAMWPFYKKLEVGEHIEYGCNELGGFNSSHLEKDTRADEKLCNQLWIELTNQDRFYFSMTQHSNANPFVRYTHRKTLALVNYDWIMRPRRGITKDVLCDDQPIGSPDYETFDMKSITNRTMFEREIFKIFDYLELQDPETPELSGHLDRLRRIFLKTYKLGFDREDMPWRKTFTKHI